ncbi:hypothetical protein TNCV_2584591 [Trichonephila clavipes]|nr:hypothetical protein TNCV_2584591 [Trichonephila clavipes]
MDFSHHIKPLTGEIDWLMWKRKIRDLLDFTEKDMEVIDGKAEKPESIDADAFKNLLTAPYTTEQNGAVNEKYEPPLKWPEHSNIPNPEKENGQEGHPKGTLWDMMEMNDTESG